MSENNLSNSSRKKLATCESDIVKLVEALAVNEKVIVIEGARTLERQAQLIKEGKSKLKDPSNGKHVVTPEKPLSGAIDLAPSPLDWENTKAFYAFAERVLKKAHALDIKLRWGGDWDGDGDFTDQKFHDLVHFELVT